MLEQESILSAAARLIISTKASCTQFHSPLVALLLFDSATLDGKLSVRDGRISLVVDVLGSNSVPFGICIVCQVLETPTSFHQIEDSSYPHRLSRGTMKTVKSCLINVDLIDGKWRNFFIANLLCVAVNRHDMGDLHIIAPLKAISDGKCHCILRGFSLQLHEIKDEKYRGGHLAFDSRAHLLPRSSVSFPVLTLGIGSNISKTKEGHNKNRIETNWATCAEAKTSVRNVDSRQLEATQ
ncbi:hypothetical protein Nepgr_026132 [Nepenthes gracilis]|uniref:Uncharacterized protein n=1 Tax=Nepenthes gracilis TaxID=150966 RepID=A0AAD3T8D3_NEPGR|nr:hypothetical protein Nepgr_026132 [Nepenthes gracilis]